MPKITFMGAGSTVFAKNVLGDSMLTPSLAESTIALYDIDAKRLEESYLMLTAIVLPLLILCMIKLYQRGHSRKAANRTNPPHWHRGAWPMYVVLGFLLCYTILTEIMLYFML